ncbi:MULTISPECIES: ABC transporter permease [unclassified Candidatus Frackibacter]|uniref:ABC transporter permease n=1 Tax=unclassified Candidatus Frackibacter TaxID=2648818 RepID=UPI00079A60FB|nr:MULTISPECIES: ABC transporter permease [unclassified Candidatus Frackibacter]KXS40590.1 MAG: tungstate transport system permease protein [Candidatus Frackibacter sp. T328-2]SDC61656.1 tungstate transport system permease protein [Candidatus Frackibacter sp. WG11]SEM75435.1 tungstate transport system permease protein [Candidatus Frackibacter sp. WG12]SFL86806.1 tungstate transport system permease protein [Candidatus Frackibacter sp. WG13]
MGYIWGGIKQAIALIIQLDPEVVEIVWTSVKLSTISTLLASIIGIPGGIAVSKIDFKGKYLFDTILNTLLSLPTVVVGLAVYSLISYRGPLGQLELLFTGKGIILGQVILILPIIVALVRNAIHEIDDRIYDTAISLGATGTQRFRLLISEARYGIMGAVVAGYGRVIGEVGVSMMLGGNIRRVTRTITTAIALETNKGRFSFGIALGLILLSISFIVNFLIYYLQTGDKE